MKHFRFVDIWMYSMVFCELTLLFAQKFQRFPKNIRAEPSRRRELVSPGNVEK